MCIQYARKCWGPTGTKNPVVQLKFVCICCHDSLRCSQATIIEVSVVEAVHCHIDNLTGLWLPWVLKDRSNSCVTDVFLFGRRFRCACSPTEIWNCWLVSRKFLCCLHRSADCNRLDFKTVINVCTCTTPIYFRRNSAHFQKTLSPPACSKRTATNERINWTKKSLNLAGTTVVKQAFPHHSKLHACTYFATKCFLHRNHPYATIKSIMDSNSNAKLNPYSFACCEDAWIAKQMNSGLNNDSHAGRYEPVRNVATQLCQALTGLSNQKHPNRCLCEEIWFHWQKVNAIFPPIRQRDKGWAQDYCWQKYESDFMTSYECCKCSVVREKRCSDDASIIQGQWSSSVFSRLFTTWFLRTAIPTCNVRVTLISVQDSFKWEFFHLETLKMFVMCSDRNSMPMLFQNT